MGFSGIRTTFDNDTATWKALVKNYGTTPQSRTWQLRINGRPTAPQTLDLQPGQATVLRGLFPGDPRAQLQLVLSDDGFDIDNRLPLVIPLKKRLRVGLATDAPMPDFFKRFFTRPDDIVPDAPDLVVGTLTGLEDRQTLGNGIYFAPSASPQTQLPRVIRGALATSQALTKGLHWYDLWVRQPHSLTPGPNAQVLVWLQAEPLIWLSHNHQGQQLICNFALHHSNAWQLPAFVVLLHRFTERIRATVPKLRQANLDTHQKLNLAIGPGNRAVDMTIRLIQGNAIQRQSVPFYQATLLRAPAEPAFIEISQGDLTLARDAVHFADTREADFTQAASFDTVSTHIPALAQRHSRRDLARAALAASAWRHVARKLVLHGTHLMITFAAPLWALLCVPLLVAIGWYHRQLRLWAPLRALCLTLLVLLLMQPRWHATTRGLDLWVLVDRSASAADGLTRHLPEWETLIQNARTAQDRLLWVDYADTPMRRGTSDATIYTGNTSRTRLAQAIRYAQAQMDEARASRLLVLTDGYSTEPLHDIAERLAAQHVPLDYRLLTASGVNDVRITRFVLPTQIQANEGFMFEVHLAGNTDGPVPYTISRSGISVYRGTTHLRRSRGVVQLSDRLDAIGAHPYRIDIDPQLDAQPGNNTATGWVDVQGGQRVLLVTRYPDDPIATALQQQGISVNVITQPADLHVGYLTGTRAIILNNIAAYHLPTDFLQALDGFVRVQGGGLLMAGGKHAFGAGGYYGSAIDPLLPVATELREEHRQYPVAMAIVLDRSGSMAAGVSGGRG